MIGAISNYLIKPVGNPLLLFGGVALVAVAIVLDAGAYRKREATAKAATTRGIVLSLVAGVLMGCFYPFVAQALNGVPGKPAPGDFAPYSTIQQTMLGHGFTRYWDDTASVPYLYSADRQEFVSYEDAESLAVKCAYIKTHKLGGAMFWQYLDDPSGALVETMARALGPSPGTSQ